MTDAGRPIVEVRVAGVEVVPARVEVTASRLAPVGRCMLALDRDQPETVTFSEISPVEVLMGRELAGVRPVFRGRVRQLSPEEQVHVIALDAMRDLRDVRVRQAFSQVTAQEVLAWVADRFGLALHAPSVPTARRRHFVAASVPVTQLLRQVQQTWGLADWDCWADVDGSVWMGPWSDTARARREPVAHLEWGRNLLEMTPSTGDTGVAETWLDEAIQHSTRVVLTDPRAWSGSRIARAERVTHTWAPGRARTRVEWAILAN